MNTQRVSARPLLTCVPKSSLEFHFLAEEKSPDVARGGDVSRLGLTRILYDTLSDGLVPAL